MTEKILIQNKYELIENIGNGTFSNVYKGRHHTKNTIVAIKFDHDKESKILIQNEIKIYLQLLKHNVSNFVNIKSFGIIGERNYIIMDFIPWNIQNYVRHNMQNLDSCQILIKLVSVLKKMHSCGYVHRDLKPDNILIKNGEICLIDLGFATKITNKKYHSIIGNYKFCSYNVHLPSYQYRKKDDIISCFYIIIYLFSNETLPWTIKNINRMNSDEFALLYNIKKYIDYSSYYKHVDIMNDLINMFKTYIDTGEIKLCKC